MKKIFIFLTFSFNIHFIYAQIDMNLTYNSIHAGRSINLTVSKTFKEKNELGVGIIYNINKIAQEDDQGNIYRKRLYASKFIEHFGIETFYHRRLTDKWEKSFEPFVFFDLQLKKAPTRNRGFSPYTNEISTGDVLYKEYLHHWGPFIWFENNIGIGYKAKISKNIYLSQKIGAGVDIILSKNDPIQDIYQNNSFLFGDKNTWEFGMLIQTGILYRFDEKGKN